MNPQFKLGLYVVTVVGSLLFGSLFVHHWRRADAAGSTSDAIAPTPAATSRVAKVTAATGAGAGETNELAASPGTAGGAEVTNEPPAEVSPERESVAQTAGPTASTRGLGRMILWGLLGIASVVGLAGLIAYDVSQYMASRATQVLFDDRGEDLPETLDDQVEKVHGTGDFLEAVRLLRDHLKEHPRAVNAQIRIAEIYEKDLHNPLAAALEYEEVLRQPLPPERRGWTAIHLVNLYNRLDKPDQALAWLQRVVAECPNTPAAVKARERLEASGIALPEPPAPSNPGSDSGSSSGLPPGFRPKGG